MRKWVPLSNSRASLYNTAKVRKQSTCNGTGVFNGKSLEVLSKTVELLSGDISPKTDGDKLLHQNSIAFNARSSFH